MSLSILHKLFVMNTLNMLLLSVLLGTLALICKTTIKMRGEGGEGTREKGRGRREREKERRGEKKERRGGGEEWRGR